MFPPFSLLIIIHFLYEWWKYEYIYAHLTYIYLNVYICVHQVGVLLNICFASCDVAEWTYHKTRYYIFIEVDHCIAQYAEHYCYNCFEILLVDSVNCVVPFRVCVASVVGRALVRFYMSACVTWLYLHAYAYVHINYKKDKLSLSPSI